MRAPPPPFSARGRLSIINYFFAVYSCSGVQDMFTCLTKMLSSLSPLPTQWSHHADGDICM